MKTDLSKIEAFYDQYDEWERLNRHRLEFEMTKKIIDTYVNGTRLEILDIGGGPGRYAIYLALKGHRVTLLDLSAKNIAIAKKKAGEASVNIDKYIHGNALQLDAYGLGQFDVVLLMGPLYHLIKREERDDCLRQALSHLRKGGIVIASFISNYAPVIDNLKYMEEDFQPESLLKYLKDGVNDETEGFTVAYFEKPETITGCMESHHLQTLDFIGIENILSTKEPDINRLYDETFEKWLQVGLKLCRDPHLWGMSEHFIYIGKKEGATGQ